MLRIRKLCAAVVVSVVPACSAAETVVEKVEEGFGDPPGDHRTVRMVLAPGDKPDLVAELLFEPVRSTVAEHGELEARVIVSTLASTQEVVFSDSAGGGLFDPDGGHPAAWSEADKIFLD